MADNINIPGIGQFPLPEWAKDDTLSNLGTILRKNGQAVDIISDLMDDGVKDINAISNKISELGSVDDAVQSQNEDTNKDYAKRLGSVLSTAAGRFNDTSKPLTSMVDFGSDIAKGAKDMAKNSKWGSKLQKQAAEKMGGFMDKFGGALGVGADVATVWAGYMAGRAEQFAQAQQQMIDSGAIMFDSTQAFEDLRQASFDAGITYLKLTEVVGNFGPAMTALGGNTSNGTVQFARLAEKLNETSDQFGDFGMTNEQLTEGFAQYVETQRLLGNVDRNQANFGDKLVSGYQELMIEQGSLASATAFSRKQLLDAQKQMSEDQGMNAAAARRRRMGDDDGAKTIEALGKSLFALQDSEIGVPSLAGPLTQAFSQAVNAMGNNAAGFDIIPFMMENGGQDVITALKQGGSTVLQDINTAVRTGDFKKANTLIMDSMVKFSETSKNIQVTAGQMNGPLGELKNIQAQSRRLAVATGKAANMTDEEKKARENQYKKQLGDSGQMTRSLNDMEEGFLKVQDMMTINMSSFANVLAGTTKFLGGESGPEKTMTQQQQKAIRHGGKPAQMAITGSASGTVPAKPGPSLSEVTEAANSKGNNWQSRAAKKREEIKQQKQELKNNGAPETKKDNDDTSILDKIMNFFGFGDEENTKSSIKPTMSPEVKKISEKLNAFTKAVEKVSPETILQAINDKKMEADVEIEEIQMRMEKFNSGGKKNKRARDRNEQDKERLSELENQIAQLKIKEADLLKQTAEVQPKKPNVVSFKDSKDNIRDDVEKLKTTSMESDPMLNGNSEKDKEYEESSLQNAENQLNLWKEFKALIDNWSNNSQNRRIMDSMYNT